MNYELEKIENKLSNINKYISINWIIKQAVPTQDEILGLMTAIAEVIKEVKELKT